MASPSRLRSRPEPGSRFLPEKDQDIIRTNLSKVDLYVEQGLVRNARRILENLMLLYPDDPPDPYAI